MTCAKCGGAILVRDIPDYVRSGSALYHGGCYRQLISEKNRAGG